MSWFLSKVYTTLRGVNSSSRSTSSSVATNRSLSDAEIDSLDLNCTVSPGNNHRYSYISYSSADKEGSSCGGWSRPASTAGSIHDGECPDGLIIKLYGEDYILDENGECRPTNPEPESKRMSTISVSCLNQNNENEKIFNATPDISDPQYEWSDEKEDWITPLGFGNRSRQSKRRSVRPRSENVDEMWLRVVKSVNASFDCDEDNTEEHIDKTYENPQQETPTQRSDIIKQDRSADDNTKVNLEQYKDRPDEEKQKENIKIIEKSKVTDENLNENDLNIEKETITSYIEATDLVFEFGNVSMEKENEEIESCFVDEDTKSDNEDEFRSSLAGTSDILNEIFQQFGLPADEVISEDETQEECDESTAHGQTRDALSAPGVGHARATEVVASRGNDYVDQPMGSVFARTGSYTSLTDCPPSDVDLLDELESIFSDRQSQLFNEEESPNEYDDIDALRKSIEDIVSGLDKRTHSELQLRRLRQSLKKLNNFETKSLKKNKHITNDSSSVTQATDTGEQSEHMHDVFGNLADEQDHYSHEMHSSGKNTSTYSDNKGSWDYSFNLNGLGYDQPIEHDSIAYAVTNNIFSAASVVLNKKQIEQANTHSAPFTESIKSVRCSDQHDTRVQLSNALLESRRDQTTNKHKHIQTSDGCGEAEQTIGATTDLLGEFCNKELLEKDDKKRDLDEGITWSGKRAGDILTMVKVQPELTPRKIDRGYRKAFRAAKPDQAVNSGVDIIEGDTINSEYLSTELDASTGQIVGRYFGSEIGYNRARVSDNDGLTYSDFNMGCISVYCKSKSQDTEHSEDEDNYYNNSGNKQLVHDEQIGKYGFENAVLDNEIYRCSPDDELESRIALGDALFDVSLKNDKNKNGINYTSPEIQRVSQIESCKLGTDLTNDSALSVDFFETEQADKDDLDSGLECQDDVRDEERVRLSLKHTDDESESFSTERTFNSSTNSGETNSMRNSHGLLSDRQEYSREETKDFCAIKSKEILIDDNEKTSSDVDSDSLWQEPFESCSGNSNQSSPSLSDHGRFVQSTTEILELKLKTLNLNATVYDIYENKDHEMGNSATYEQRSSFEEEGGEYDKDSKHGFWEGNGVKSRRSGAFGIKRGSDRASQFYVPLDPSFEEDTISAQTAEFVNFAPIGDSSTGENFLEDTIREGSPGGKLEQDDNHSDCTSASSSSLGIARIFNEDPQTIDYHEHVDTHLFNDNERIGTDDVESLASGSVTTIASHEHRAVIRESITEGSADQSLNTIDQSKNSLSTKIKHWKSVDGLILRLHTGTDGVTIASADDDEDNNDGKRANDIDVGNHELDHQTVGDTMDEYEGHPVIHDKLNNNCNKIEDSLSRQSEVVIQNGTQAEEVITPKTMDTENIDDDKRTEIRNIEDEWQRNRRLRQKKREEMRKREQALQDKVNWVRDEIKIMKELDKKLMDQFFELRSVIHQMTYAKTRPMRDLNISDLDEEDTFYEDAEIVEFDNQVTPAHEQYIPAFRGRTVSMMTPPCERILSPWKHNRRMPSFTTEDDVPLEMLL